MTTWAAITDPQTQTGAIITQTLMRQYRDNLRALMEDDASVPALDTLKRFGRQNTVFCGTADPGGAETLRVNGTVRMIGLKLHAGSIISAGSIAQDATYGTNIWCNTGASYDFSMFTPGGAYMCRAGGGAGALNFEYLGNIDAVSLGTTGTFTPSLVGSGGGSAHTYATRTGWYRKVGKTVHFTLNVRITAKDGTMTGSISISGLPFTTAAAPGSGAVSIGLMDAYTRATAGAQVLGLLPSGATAIVLLESLVSYTNSQPAAIGATFNIIISGTYEAT